MKRSDEPQSMATRCACPYCDEELMATTMPYCRQCTVTLHYCVTCKIAVPKDAEACPSCGSGLL